MYDLNSAEGWFSANGLIVANCQCYGTPATESNRGKRLNPMSFFEGLSRSEQDRRFTIAGAQAVRDGGDIYSVVNARRGMTTWDAYGRRIPVTSEGTTRFGSYYRLKLAEAEAATGQRFARGVADVEQGLPRFRLRAPRLMPSEIYGMAKDREELIKLLRRYAYLR